MNNMFINKYEKNGNKWAPIMVGLNLGLTVLTGAAYAMLPTTPGFAGWFLHLVFISYILKRLYIIGCYFVGDDIDQVMRRFSMTMKQANQLKKAFSEVPRKP